MSNKIRIKPFINKKNKQMNIALPKKKLKAANPSLKFNEDLFVMLEVFNKPKRKKE